MKPGQKILVTRTDQLGDVLLALPVLEYLKKELPSYSISFLCRKRVLEVIAPYLASEQIEGIAYDPPQRISAQFKKFDGILFLFTEGRLLFNAWRARVPLRVGIRSKAPSLLFLTHGLWQHRSQAEKHESHYNLELAKLLVSQLEDTAQEPELSPIELIGDPPSEAQASVALESLDIAQGSPFILFHPGMGGSALNLSGSDYAKLIRLMAEKTSLPVILSIGPSDNDQELRRIITAEIPDIKVLKGLELTVIREVFRRASLVVAPSTGPLHLAHYCGTATVGLYAPVKSQHPKRWAPMGGRGASRVLYPEIDCPGHRECIGDKCEHYFCMAKLDWGQLILEQGNDLMPR